MSTIPNLVTNDFNKDITFQGSQIGTKQMYKVIGLIKSNNKVQ